MNRNLPIVATEQVMESALGFSRGGSMDGSQERHLFPTVEELQVALMLSWHPTPTHPNEVGILDGVGGVIGSDVVDLGISFFSLFLPFSPVLKSTIKCLHYIRTYDPRRMI